MQLDINVNECIYNGNAQLLTIASIFTQLAVLGMCHMTIIPVFRNTGRGSKGREDHGLYGALVLFVFGTAAET